MYVLLVMATKLTELMCVGKVAALMDGTDGKKEAFCLWGDTNKCIYIYMYKQTKLQDSRNSDNCLVARSRVTATGE